MKKLRQQFQDRLGDAGTQAEESLSSIRTVRTFSGEKKSCGAYGEDVNKSYLVGKKLSALGGNPFAHYDNTPMQYTAIFHGCKKW